MTDEGTDCYAPAVFYTKIAEAEPTSGGGVILKDSLATPISSASTSTIQNVKKKVKDLKCGYFPLL